MADVMENAAVANNFQAWLSQGEQLYSTAFAEFRALEAEMESLEKKLTAKQAEVNQIAQIIGKPPIEGTKVVNAHITPVPAEVVHAERMSAPAIPAIPMSPTPSNSANATIARALTGKFGTR